MANKKQTHLGLAGPVLCYGFAAVVAMWIVAFVTHYPGLQVSARTTAIVLVGTLLAVCIFAGGSVERARSWKVGLGAGLVASIVNLLVFGSYLSDPAAGPAPGKAVAILGFLGLGVVTGLIGGILGTILEGIFSANRAELIVPAGEPDWLARFGIVTAAAAFPLLVLGGLVTSAGAALSVPDWPNTYGSNMFLYPIGLMTRPRIFLEHSHRLFGSMVGLTTIVLLVYSLVGEHRRWMRIWMVCIFLLVVVQGVLGGIRVNDQSTGLAFVHGITAQVFFALLVAYAACLSPMFKNPALPRGVVSHRRAKVVITAFLHSIIPQLIFGALYRHFGSPHAMYTHIAFSLFVLIAAVFAAFEIRSLLARQTGAEWDWPRRAMNLLGALILACVTLQFMLGWAALFVVGIHKGKPDLPVAGEAVTAPANSLAQQIIPTVHQANGALLLGLATLAYVWVRRFWRRNTPA